MYRIEMQTLIISLFFFRLFRPVIAFKNIKKWLCCIQLIFQFQCTWIIQFHLSSKVKSVDICYNIKFHLFFFVFLFSELVFFLLLFILATYRSTKRNVSVCVVTPDEKGRYGRNVHSLLEESENAYSPFVCDFSRQNAFSFSFETIRKCQTKNKKEKCSSWWRPVSELFRTDQRSIDSMFPLKTCKLSSLTLGIFDFSVISAFLMGISMQIRWVSTMINQICMQMAGDSLWLRFLHYYDILLCSVWTF